MAFMQDVPPLKLVYPNGALSVKQTKRHTYGAMLCGLKQRLKYSSYVKLKSLLRPLVRHTTWLKCLFKSSLRCSFRNDISR